jgi:hypothetical protein
VVELGYGDPTGLPAAARAAWAAARSGEVREAPAVFGDRAGAVVGHRCEVCRSPLLWTGVGVGLVVGAIAIVAASSASHPPPSVTITGGSFGGHP